MDAPDVAYQGQAPPSKLRGVRKHGHFPGCPEHLRVQLRFEHARRGGPRLRIEAVYAKEKVVSMQIAHHALRRRARKRSGYMTEHATDHDQRYVG